MTRASVMATRDRAAAHRQPARHDDHRRDAVAGARVLARRRDPVRPQHRGRRAGGRARARRPAAVRHACRCGSASIRRAGAWRASRRRSPSGRRWRCWAGAATRRWRAGSRPPWRPNCAPSASRWTTRRSSTSTPTRRTRSSATGPCRPTPTWWRGSARPSSAGCRTTASPPAASTFPGHGDTSVDSHLELPLVEHPPDRIRRVECVPFEAAIAAERGLHHDRARPGAVARRGAAGHAVARASSTTCCATSSASRA